MGIEINDTNRNIKVNGRELSEYDKNSDNKIKGSELIDFTSNAIKDTSLTNDNYKKLFGYDKHTWVGDDDTAIKFMADALASADKAAKSEGKAGLDNREAFVDALYKKYAGSLTDTKVQEYINKSLAVYDAFVSKPRSNKDEIDKLYSSVKKDMKKNDGIDKFQKQILDVLVAEAEQECADKEYAQFDKSFRDLIKTKSWEDAFNEASKQYKGSYYDNGWTKNSGHKALRVSDGDYENGIKKSYEDKTIMPLARQTVRNAMYTVREALIKGEMDSDGLTPKKLKQMTEAKLKETKKWNSYTQKALNGETSFMSGEWWSGTDSSMKTTRKNYVAKVEVYKARNEKFSDKQIKETIDPTLFQELVNSDLITENEDGTYSIKELSVLLENCFGQDFTLNHQLPLFRALSEVLNTKKELAMNMEDRVSFADEQISNLAKLCKYRESDKINALKTAYRSFLAMAVPAGTGAAAAGGAEAWTGARHFRRVKLYHYHNKLNLDIQTTINIYDDQGYLTNTQTSWLDGTASDIKVDDDYAVVIGTKTGVQIKIDKNLPVEVEGKVDPKVAEQTLKGLAIGAGIGLITSSLAALVSGGVKEGEYPFINKEFDCTEKLSDYEKLLDVDVADGRITPEEKQGIMMSAKTFEKDGVWNCDEYKRALNYIGGKHSVLNRQEFIDAITAYWKDHNKPVEEEKGKYCISAPKTETKAPVETKIDTINGDKYQWKHIAKQYDCLDEVKAVRYLKIAQGITDGNYSKERLDSINQYAKAILRGQYTVTRTPDGKDATTTIGNVTFEHFDADKFRHQLQSAIKGTIVMPGELAGCTRNKNVALLSRKAGGTPTNTTRNNTVYDTQRTPGSSTTTPGHVKATNGRGETVEDRDITTEDDYNSTKKKYEDDSNYKKDC